MKTRASMAIGKEADTRGGSAGHESMPSTGSGGGVPHPVASEMAEGKGGGAGANDKEVASKPVPLVSRYGLDAVVHSSAAAPSTRGRGGSNGSSRAGGSKGRLLRSRTPPSAETKSPRSATRSTKPNASKGHGVAGKESVAAKTEGGPAKARKVTNGTKRCTPDGQKPGAQQPEAGVPAAAAAKKRGGGCGTKAAAGTGTTAGAGSAGPAGGGLVAAPAAVFGLSRTTNALVEIQWEVVRMPSKIKVRSLGGRISSLL